MVVSSTQFDCLADLVRRRSGLALPPDKLALVQSKLAPVAARFGFRTVGQLLADLEEEPEELARAVTEAMTTNETSFFRDPACFDHLREVVLPALMAARSARRRLRIWCAAASTGQEPYSLAMLLDDAGLTAGGWKVDLFATDLSGDAIARLRQGTYAAHELERGLPEGYRVRYFTQEDEQWRIADHLRRSLRIHKFNLLDNFGWLGTMDLILCRNVLFYFEGAARIETLARLDGCLAADGWLVLGAAERAAKAFTSVGDARGVYVKADSARSRQVRRAG